MIRYVLFFVLVWAFVFSTICIAQRASLRDWALFARVAGKSLLTTAIAAAIIAALVFMF